MARSAPYLFCRYEIRDKDENVLSPDKELELFEGLIGEPVAHRIRDPKKEDFDTYLVKPRKKQIAGHRAHTWEVAQDIRFRERSRYNKDKDETIDDTIRASDEIRHTKFIGLPTLKVFAVDDRISERALGARSACSRLRSIIEDLSDNEITISFAGTPEDTQRALETWTLDRFSFTVRPFNPTPTKLGEKIHDLLIVDHVGKLQAVAYPDQSHEMRDSHEGIISEAKGLSDAGYGQVAASGTTPSGVRATLSKPKFEMDKEKNKQHQTENRVLKIYIEGGQTPTDEETAVVKALLDLYGKHPRKA